MTTRLVPAVLAIALLAPQAAPAHDLPAPVHALIDQRAADCTSFGGAQLTVEDGALTRVDLTGDGTDDWVLDDARLDCKGEVGLYCGTGGCTVHFIVGDTVETRLAQGWEVIDLGPIRTILVQLDGASCGGLGLELCVEALVWFSEEGRFASVAPPPPQ